MKSCCPDRDQFERYLAGQLNESASEALETHVEACPQCQRTLEAMTRDTSPGSLQRLLKVSRPRPLNPTPSDCQDDGQRLPPTDDERPRESYPDFLRNLANVPPIVAGSAAGPPGGTLPPTEDWTQPAAVDYPAVPGYEVLEVLGRGGMGVVYKARHLELKRLVALKMLLAGTHASAAELDRFRTEAKAVARLQHAHIVQIYEVGTSGTCPYLALEFVEGGSLACRLGGDRKPARQAAQLVETLAQTMHYAHQRGIVHRDLKPGNILLTADGTPKITDFGLAKLLDQETGQSRHTALVGTPCYMAPEQVEARAPPPSPSLDVYALGAILYEMLTGRPPFQEATTGETLYQVRFQEPEPPRALQPAMPRDLEKVCLKCLRKEPPKRYRTALALAEDLRRFLAGEPVVARPPPAWERGLKWARRHPTAAVLAFVSILVPFLVVFAGWWSNWRTQQALHQREQQLTAEYENLLGKQRDLAQTAGQLARQERDNLLIAQQRRAADAARHALKTHDYEELRRALSGLSSFRRGWEDQRLQLELALAPHPVQVVGTHDWGVSAFLASRDGRQLVSSGLDGRVVCWDTATLKGTELEHGLWSETLLAWQPALFPLRTDPTDSPNPKAVDCFASLCWVSDGRVLAGASVRGRGVVWELGESGDSIHRQELIPEHERPLSAVAASADGRHLLFGDDRGTLLHRDRQQSGGNTLPLPGGAILAVEFVAPHFWVVGQEDGQVSLVDLGAARVLGGVKLPGPVWSVDVGDNGKLVAVGCAGDRLQTLDIDPGVGAVRLRGETYFLPESEVHPPRALHAVRISPDGRQIAAGDDLGRLMLWNRGEAVPEFVKGDQIYGPLGAERVASLPIPFQRRFAGIAFGPGGQSLFTAGRECVLKRWTLASPRGLTCFAVGSEPRVRYDPGKTDLLWVGTADGRVSLWDSRRGERRYSREAHHGAITGLDVARQAGIAATCGTDQTIRFWAQEGNQIAPVGSPIEHEHSLRSVAISPDGARVAAYDVEDQVSL
ncbi:MAG: protein kinase, partial [Planctomycetes bacterium]|nr:protein kinase [Planctomycetota bacterium]